MKGSSEVARMALLTFSMIGIQFTWGLEMTYCTPYLLQLGLSKSGMSLVWIAGPLSGLVMQPLVGVLSDSSTNKMGRRRPFMLLGSVIVGLCVLVLGWTSELVGIFVSDPVTRKRWTIAVAVMTIYVVDFAVNAVQANCRSLIVDTLPEHKQQLGSAWASRMVSAGQIFVYGVSALDLPRIFGNALGDTQFKQLCVISATGLLFAVGVTCYSVQERVLLNTRDEKRHASLVKVLSQILRTIWHLPKRIRGICWVFFWTWFGWFPFLFYNTTWVGEIYFRYEAPKDPKTGDPLGDLGRIGSLPLFIFSFVSFVCSVTLPWLVQSPSQAGGVAARRPRPRIAPLVKKLRRYQPDLMTMWVLGNFIFGAAMLLAPLVRSVRFAICIVSICGIPWSVGAWAPFTFLGVEITKMGSSQEDARRLYRRLDGDEDEQLDSRDGETVALHLHHPADSESSGSASELAGIYLGILNVFATLPQFLATFTSSIVFAVLEPGKSPELAKGAHPDEHHPTNGPNAISVCLFIGALAAILAGFLTIRLKHMQ